MLSYLGFVILQCKTVIDLPGQVCLRRRNKKVLEIVKKGRIDRISVCPW
jgi:hypothetical protein